MLTFYSFIVEFTLGKQMVATGKKARDHAKKYLSNPKDTFITASKVGHIGKDERVNLHGTRYDEPTDTHYATISHPDSPKNKIEVPINKLRKPPERSSGHGKRDAETNATDNLHNQIVEHNKKKPLMMKDRFGKTHHIVGAIQIKGNPKADVALVNDKGEHVIHISHKKNESSNQGYGALNGQENWNHPVVADYASRLKKDKSVQGNEGLEKKSRTYPLHHNVPEESSLIKRALFGNHHEDKVTGKDNVDEIHHGLMKLVANNDGTHSVESDEKIDRTNYKKDDYELVGKHATDRPIPNTTKDAKNWRKDPNAVGGILGVWKKSKRGGTDVKPLKPRNINN